MLGTQRKCRPAVSNPGRSESHAHSTALCPPPCPPSSRSSSRSSTAEYCAARCAATAATDRGGRGSASIIAVRSYWQLSQSVIRSGVPCEGCLNVEIAQWPRDMSHRTVDESLPSEEYNSIGGRRYAALYTDLPITTRGRSWELFTRASPAEPGNHKRRWVAIMLRWMPLRRLALQGWRPGGATQQRALQGGAEQPAEGDSLLAYWKWLLDDRQRYGGGAGVRCRRLPLLPPPRARLKPSSLPALSAPLPCS